MKIFIVEDNARHLNLLKSKVESLGYEVAGTSQEPSEAAIRIKETSPDVILLDINLGEDHNGIRLAKEITAFSAAPILFITSQRKDDIIQEAIVIEPAGYLIKPVDPADLKANIELALYKKGNHPENGKQSRAKPEGEFLTVRTGKKLQLLSFKDIKLLQVETKNHVTLVDSNDKQYVIRDSLKNLLDAVLPDYFIRTHHSYGANLKYIAFIDEKEQMIILKTNDAIPIGKGFKKNVYEKMNIKS